MNSCAWRLRAAHVRAEGGQSVVELVAATPIVLICGLLCLQALAAGASHVYADNASHAGALAATMGEDPARAARAALPGWSRGRVRVTVRRGSVRVRLRPRALVPPLAGLLTTESMAAYVSPGGLRNGP